MPTSADVVKVLDGQTSARDALGRRYPRHAVGAEGRARRWSTGSAADPRRSGFQQGATPIARRLGALLPLAPTSTRDTIADCRSARQPEIPIPDIRRKRRLTMDSLLPPGGHGGLASPWLSECFLRA